MEIIIDDSIQLFEIQEIFNNHFPYLKLEFFKWDPIQEKTYSKSELITDVNKTVGEIRHIHQAGSISINGHQKVSTFEKNLFKGFGLNAQVFRKSSKTWLQTGSTDEWTLQEQNQMAQEINTISQEKPLQEDDYYHEQP